LGEGEGGLAMAEGELGLIGLMGDFGKDLEIMGG
jgi:hypothetical protein